MAYNVDFKALALWIGLAAVIAGGYFVITSDTSSPVGEESSLSLGIQQDEIKPGDTIRIEATNSEGPVEDVEINVNDEDIGDTNENGIAGYSVPQDAEKIDISGQHQGATATVEASLENGEFNVDEGSDSSDEGDDSDSVSDGSDQNDGSNSGSEDDGDQNESGSGEDSTADSGDQNTDEETNDQDSGQDNQTDSPGSGETGLELESSPVAEELNTVTLTKDGDSVADASVYVNNDEVGTTTSTGSLTFTVPNAQEITVSTDADIQSETFTVEGYTNETDGDTPDEEFEALNAYYQYTPENPSIGDEIEFDASQTTGNNIQSYEWSLGNGATATGQTVTQTYEENGTYNVELTVTDGDGNTDSASSDVSIQELPEPTVELVKPAEDQEFSSDNIEYRIDVYNGVSGSDYRIKAGGNNIATGKLSNDGKNEIITTENVPDGTFDTKAEVVQGTEVYSSSTHSVTAGQDIPDPEFTINSPNDQEIVTYYDTEDVQFSYSVQEAGWADEGIIRIPGTSKSSSRTISTGDNIEEQFELQSSKEGTEYDVEVELTNGTSQKVESTSFNLTRNEPAESISIDNIEVQEDGYTTQFNITASSEKMREVYLNIDADWREGPIFSGTPDEAPFEWSPDQETIIDYAGTYTAILQLRDAETGEIVEEKTQQFTTTSDGSDGPTDDA